MDDCGYHREDIRYTNGVCPPYDDAFDLDSQFRQLYFYGSDQWTYCVKANLSTQVGSDT